MGIRKTSDIAAAIDAADEPTLRSDPRLKNVFPDLKSWPEQEKYNVALIPMRIPLSKYRKKEYEKNVLYLLESNNAEHVRKLFFNSMKECIRNNCKIVVYNEFSYPIMQDGQLRPYLENKCQSEEMFVVAGSYHEFRNMKSPDFGYCICPIFNFSRESIINQIKNKKGRHNGKLEKINVPDEGKFNIINSRLGRFVVSICSDITDADLEWNIRTINRLDTVYYNPIDMVIVPSYTEKPYEISTYSQHVSRETNTFVMFVENNPSDNNPQVFRCGEKIEYKDEIEGNDTRPNIYIFEIDLLDFRLERLKRNLSKESSQVKY